MDDRACYRYHVPTGRAFVSQSKEGLPSCPFLVRRKHRYRKTLSFIGYAVRLSHLDKISVENGEEEKLNPFRDDTTAM